MKLLRLLPVLMLPLLGACALERDYVEVRHTPPANVAPVPGAQMVSVRLTASDARDANRERVGVKKNGYGMEMAAIVARNDVVEEVRAAVGAVLTAQGFAITGGAGEVRVELLRFFNDFKVGFWSGTAEADVSINLRVLDASGAMLYSRVVTVTGINPGVVIASGTNAQRALVDGLNHMMAAVASDEEFRRAMLRLAPTADPPRRGRPAA